MMATYPAPGSWYRTLSGTTVEAPVPASSAVAVGGSFGTVTFGAFSDPSSFLDSYSASVLNVNLSATVSGSGLGPYTISGAVDGEFLVITLDGLNEGGKVLTAAVWSGAIEKPTGGLSWVDQLDLDLTDLTTTSALSTGTTVLGFDSSATTVSVVFTRNGGAANASVTPTNGTGLVFDGGTDITSSAVVSFDIGALLSGYSVADARDYQYAVHLVLENIDISYSVGNSGFLTGINSTGTNSNNVNARKYQSESLSGGTDERVRVGYNTTNSGWSSGAALRASRVITFIVIGGRLVIVMDTAGTTPPTPDAGSTGGTFPTRVIGGNTQALASTGETYAPDLRAFVAPVDGGDLTLTRILVQRQE